MYRFHHACLSVSNRQQSVVFYGKLGFREAYLWEAEDGSLSITHLKLEGVILELFCYRDSRPAPDTIHDTVTDLPVIGTKHFGLRVDSIEDARKDLIATGMAPSNIVIKHGRTGPRFFFIKDPDGILVEIIQDDRKL